MSLSPLQKRISELSFRAVETNDFDEFQQVACELKMALREQVAYLRGMVIEAKKTIASIGPESKSRHEETYPEHSSKSAQ